VHADLFEAVKSSDTAHVRRILASNPDAAGARDSEGATALHHATEIGHREIVAVLLENGADINARDDRHHATPAGWAIEYLRASGGLLAMEIEDVLFAIRENDTRWVRRFVTRLPALAKAKDARGKPLAQHAAESGNEEICRLFPTPDRKV
jgi:hypothetical protein